MGNEFKKESNKFKLFKDKKQAILAIIVLLLFGTSLINVFSKNNNNPDVANQEFTDNYNFDNNNNINTQNFDANGQPNQNMQNPDANMMAQDAQNIYNQSSNMQADDSIEILAKKPNSIERNKKILITIEDSGRNNPFKPSSVFNKAVQSVEKLPMPLIAPPVGNDEVVDKTATTVMQTSVSGILYDQYSPSAILNLKNDEGKGSDYLVSVGDTLNGYKILAISKTKVTVKLGHNIYIAGVGEYLKKADLDSSKNLSNINHKFGGNNVTIRVKKK